MASAAGEGDDADGEGDGDDADGEGDEADGEGDEAGLLLLPPPTLTESFWPAEQCPGTPQMK